MPFYLTQFFYWYWILIFSKSIIAIIKQENVILLDYADQNDVSKEAPLVVQGI